MSGFINAIIVLMANVSWELFKLPEMALQYDDHLDVNSQPNILTSLVQLYPHFCCITVVHCHKGPHWLLRRPDKSFGTKKWCSSYTGSKQRGR